MRQRHAHPIVFMFLILPFGVMSGYLTVAVAYLLTRAGVSVEAVASLIAISYVPHTWKFLWAPIADTTLTRKGWYVLSAVLSGAGIWATGVLPMTAASLPLLTGIVLVSNLAVTFLAMSCESLMAYTTSAEEKGRAGGWFQAGNLGGAGIGGGAGLWMAQHLHAPWMAGAVLGTLSLLCMLAVVGMPEPPATHRVQRFGASLINVGRDLWGVTRSRIGFLALLICFLPIGSGAASGLWSAVAGDWRASAGTVALVTGVLGGLAAAAGCVVGGLLCDRMDRKVAYGAYGLMQAACAIGMAVAPRTEASYIVFTLAYAFITGFTYAAFSAVVLEAIGLGAAATKYSLFASLSNMPIAYMTVVNGWAHTCWGPAGMLLTEAAICVAGLLLFIGVATSTARRAPSPA